MCDSPESFRDASQKVLLVFEKPNNNPKIFTKKKGTPVKSKNRHVRLFHFPTVVRSLQNSTVF